MQSPALDIRNGEELWVGGHMKEEDDPSPNDSIGNRFIRIPHDKLPSAIGPQIYQKVQYQESDQKAEAMFIVQWA